MFASQVMEEYQQGKRFFVGAELNHTYFGEANLEGASFFLSQLSCARFDDANLQDANFGKCDLSYASFKGANLHDADFTSANLYRADFRGANLNNADFTGAKITRVKGIASVSNVGEDGEMIFAYRHEGVNRFQFDRFNATYADAVETIAKTYDTRYLQHHFKAYRAAIEYLNACIDAQYEE